jgi:hypothetical protein
MTHAIAPPPTPAYTATLTIKRDAPNVRKVRLSARQVAALTRPIPVPLTSPSPWPPCTQAEIVIEHAVERLLKDRLVSVTLWRDRDAGAVSVWHGDDWMPIASVDLTPARQDVAA